MAITAMQAARLACEHSGWSLTNLQLQKILYLAHMIYAGRKGDKLIGDQDFQAWNLGPVIPQVYRHVSGFGDKPIHNIFRRYGEAEAGSDEASMIQSAVDFYKDYPAFQLVEITHDEKGAWRKYFSSNVRNATIPQSAIKAEYERRNEKRSPATV